MSFGYFTGSLAATSLAMCVCLSLSGCGQKGELYMPAKQGAQVSLFERRNEKSQYIFGPSAQVTSSEATSSEATPAPAKVDRQPSKGGKKR